MKNLRRFHKRVLTILAAFLLLSCGRGWYPDNTNNLELTDFTKELIATYLADSLITDCSQRNNWDENTLICEMIDSSYNVCLWAEESTLYKRRCYESFVGSVPYLGKTYYMNHSIRVFGEELGFVLSVNGPARQQGRCKTEYWEFDPLEWIICLNSDTTFCREKTILFLKDKDLSAVEHLVNKYFGSL